MEPSTPAPVSCADDLDPVLADLVERLTDRIQAGESVNIQDCQREYPQYAHQLRTLIPALHALAEVGRSVQGQYATLVTNNNDEPGSVLGDYRIVRMIGRGGMGVVHEAVQESLGRRVALKVLPTSATLDPHQLQRFQNEARAAASLDHPHIVKVHAVGSDRGVHYFAMQFIEGQSLEEFLRVLRGPAASRPRFDPTYQDGGLASTDDRTGSSRAQHSTIDAPNDKGHFRRVAEWGIQAAEALEHAHSLSIVHRDIKPGNLLIDSHGQLWVTDFGLAFSASASRLTMSGDVVGTLRYMSPEQALGRPGRLDHRTDIYSLGATLYELLTLQQPFDGESREAIMKLIVYEDPVSPYRLNRSIPLELETIVLKAMAKNPSERYATAQELVDDLRRFLNDEPIHARRPTLAQRVRRWARRHQTLVWSAGVGIVATLAVLAGSIGWVIRDQTAVQSQVTIDVERELNKVERLQDRGEWPEALAAFERADTLAAHRKVTLPTPLRERLIALKMRLDREAADRRFVERVDRYHQQRAEVDEIGGQFVATQALPGLREALKSAGVDMGVTPIDQAVSAIQQRPDTVQKLMLAALDEYRCRLPDDESAECQWIDTVLDRADQDDWRRQVRQASAAHKWALLEQLAVEVKVEDQPVGFLVMLARRMPRQSRPAQIALLRRVQAEYPNDFWSNHGLGLSLKLDGKGAEAARFHTAALALRPRNAGVHLNRSSALLGAGEIDAAIADARLAMLYAPGYASAYLNLAEGLSLQGKKVDALEALQQAEQMAPSNPQVYFIRGRVMQTLGNLDGAIAAFRKTSALAQDSGRARVSLGVALDAKGDREGAAVAYREAISADPHNLDVNLQLATAYLARGDLDNTIAAYRRAAEISPRDPVTLYNLGNILLRKKAFKEAVSFYRRSLALDPRCAEAHCNLGVTLLRMKDVAEARRSLQKAIEINPQCAPAHAALGNYYLDRRELDQAATAFRTALHIDPKLLEGHCGLAQALMLAGDLDRSIMVSQQALAINDRHAPAHFTLGSALQEKKNYDGAYKAYCQGLALDKSDPLAHFNFGVILQQRDDIKGALVAYREALVLDPDNVRALNNLGALLNMRGDRDSALEKFRRAVEIDPRFYHAQINLGNSLRTRGDLDDALTAYRAAIDIQPDNAQAHFYAGRTLDLRGEVEWAIAAYRNAIRLQPSYAEAHCNLGQQLRQAGKFREGLDCLKRGHELGTSRGNWNYASDRWIAECERQIDLEARLPALLQNKDKPRDTQETIDLARLYRIKGLNARAARLFQEAMTAPEFAAHRTEAAGTAALAGCGIGDDATALDKQLRKQALQWARAEVEVRRKQLSDARGRKSAQQALMQLLRFAPLACVRDDHALDRLPEAERTEWQKLWNEVRLLVSKGTPIDL